MEKLWSVAELVKEHGERVVGRRCCCCGEALLYAVGPYRGIPDHFLVCLKCDVTADERRAAGFGM